MTDSQLGIDGASAAQLEAIKVRPVQTPPQLNVIAFIACGYHFDRCRLSSGTSTDRASLHALSIASATNATRWPAQLAQLHFLVVDQGEEMKLSLSRMGTVVVASVLASCGGGGGGGSSQKPDPVAPSPATPTASSPSGNSSATATLVSPTDVRFQWNLATPTTVVLKDATGATVPASTVNCTPTNAGTLAVSADCSSITALRIGAQSVTVSGAGVSATFTVQGVPQRQWSGVHGSGSPNGDTSLIATPSGSALSWGPNYFGMLGLNKSLDDLPSTDVPSAVLGTSGTAPMPAVYQVSAGDESMLALTEDGLLYAWGRNSSRQLGRADIVNSTPLAVPVLNPAQNGSLSGVVKAEIGASNGVALLDDGHVIVWGDYAPVNPAKSTVDQLPGLALGPDGAATLDGIVDVSAGTFFTLALASDGRVYAWGFDLGQGRIGSGTASSQPVALPSTVKKADGTELANIVAISAGYDFSLALASDGSVWAWGSNANGQIGQGTQYNVLPAAVQVKDANGTAVLRDITMVAAGGNHAMALRSDGSVYAWGNATAGELGDGPNRPAGNQSLLPRLVVNELAAPSLAGIVSIATGYKHSMALKSDGTVLSWGDDFRGTLGRPTADAQAHPLPAPVTAASRSGPLILTPLDGYRNLTRRAR